MTLHRGGVEHIGQTVDLAVHAGHGRLDVRVFFHHGLDVGGVLVDQVGQVDKDALWTVGLFIGDGVGVVAQDDVAVLAAHQGDVFLLGPGLRVIDLELKVDVGDLGQALEDLQFAPVGGACVLASHDAQGDRFVDDGILAHRVDVVRAGRFPGAGCRFGRAFL